MRGEPVTFPILKRNESLPYFFTEDEVLSIFAAIRNLIEMRRVDFVKKVGPKYHLTKYGAVLFEGLGEVLAKLYPIPPEALLEPQEEKAII